MKRRTQMLIGIGLVAAAAVLSPAVWAQEAAVDKAVVPLSNPSKPALIEVSLIRGGITVKGYEGKDVIVEGRPRERLLSRRGDAVAPAPAVIPEPPEPPAPPSRHGRDRDRIREEKAAGMKRIPAGGSGLTIEEEDNVVSIQTEGWKLAYDLTIQAPFNSSLKLETTNDGDILVENISGELEIENVNGSIHLVGVTGSVVTSTVNGEIQVTLLKAAPGKAMSFTTMNGDIDVTLPADAKATVKAKSERGDIYTDFDLALRKVEPKAEEARKESGRYRVSFERPVVGDIGGGGPEFSFSTFNGDIYLRKKK
ncbi:MAG: DUF4097 family beta strand repeat protein [Candidatus Aminicenantes bacterium]|nr:DUF4097 family beta strand repeat protein [Candidatus Aminicenantes bacterium]